MSNAIIREVIITAAVAGLLLMVSKFAAVGAIVAGLVNIAVGPLWTAYRNRVKNA